ncbi:MAG: acyltransferase, partial [bacterium]
NAWTNAEKNIIETFDKDATIIIGENTRLNGAWIQSRKDITVGKNCILGSTSLIDTEFHPLPGKDEIPSNSIEIEDNVWIGGKSAILKGVTVGEGSVVGFGSVVRTDIPSKSVVIGNPAQVVKKLE